MAYSVAKKKEGYSTSDKCFMPENGKVTVTLPNEEGEDQVFEFPVYDGLWITDVCLFEGERVCMSKGVQHTYVVTSIYKEVGTKEFELSRLATIQYLIQIEEGVQNGLVYVDTCFGLKKLSWYEGAGAKRKGMRFAGGFTKA